MARLIEGYFEKERQLLDILYRDWPVGEEVRDINQANITDTINRASIGKALVHFEALGILTKRLEYGVPGVNMGRHYHYTLLLSHDEARGRLAVSIVQRREASIKAHEEGNKRSANSRRDKPAKRSTEVTQLALATSPNEEVRAIAGDEPDTTLRNVFQAARKSNGADESAALVEAARQYQGRSGALRSKVTELEAIAKDLGMTIDTAALMATVSFEPDPVLEVVGQVLPYITSLEQRIARLGETVSEQRAKLDGYDALKTANRRLSEQNQRLVSEKIQVGATH